MSNLLNGHFEMPETQGKTEEQLVDMLKANSLVKDNMLHDFKIVQYHINLAIYEKQQERRAAAKEKADTQGPVRMEQGKPQPPAGYNPV